jgi:RNA polymerase sigma-70 factor (ECF subfamily)
MPLTLASGNWSVFGRQFPLQPAREGALLWARLQAVWCSSASHAKMAPVVRDDERDITETLNGDGRAYARLVERYQQEVGRWMWRFTRDRSEWEVLVQDVFVEAYTSLSRFRGEGAFGAWLRTISTRVGYRFWTRRKRQAVETTWSLQDWDELASQQDPEVASPQDAAQLVHQLLANVGPRDRLVLTLHYLDGQSVEQIAEQTGWTKTMVKVQMHRARKRLRKLLPEIG